jgi:spore germination cell wall hydrolase CwlJ-like protein
MENKEEPKKYNIPGVPSEFDSDVTSEQRKKLLVDYCKNPVHKSEIPDLPCKLDPNASDEKFWEKTLTEGLDAACEHSYQQMLAAEGVSMPAELVAAMTIWGEARGEPFDGIAAVASVIHRRAMIRSERSGYPLLITISEVCLAHKQFDCWKDGKFAEEEPDMNSEAWNLCHNVALELFKDSFTPFITATHYYAESMPEPPYWAAKIEFVGKYGAQLFYNDPNWRG